MVLNYKTNLYKVYKIPNEAVKALKQSRKYCKSAETGMPNLTGIHTKKFGSSESSSLLEKIRMRNKGIYNHPINCSKSDASSSDFNKDKMKSSDNPVDRSVEMAKSIEYYFKNNTKTFNKSTTQDIVDYFSNRINDSDSAKFKSILKNLCYLNKNKEDKSKSYCSLKDEYL